MYPILVLQAAAVGLALLMTCPDRPAGTVRTEPQPVVRTPAPSETPRMRCRLYFGCTPAMVASKSSYSQ